MFNNNDSSIPQAARDWHKQYLDGLIDSKTLMNRLGELSSSGYSFPAIVSELFPQYAQSK